ncbi:hypothetical protein J6590_004340 [Homalodisca vitripennis]|nr:hypothetical protein J6590_004340 [Homalodisca vitripennis]
MSPLIIRTEITFLKRLRQWPTRARRAPSGRPSNYLSSLEDGKTDAGFFSLSPKRTCFLMGDLIQLVQTKGISRETVAYLGFELDCQISTFKEYRPEYRWPRIITKSSPGDRLTVHPVSARLLVQAALPQCHMHIPGKRRWPSSPLIIIVTESGSHEAIY